MVAPASDARYLKWRMAFIGSMGLLAGVLAYTAWGARDFDEVIQKLGLKVVPLPTRIHLSVAGFAIQWWWALAAVGGGLAYLSWIGLLDFANKWLAIGVVILSGLLLLVYLGRDAALRELMQKLQG